MPQPRLNIERRKNYSAVTRQDQFIVPLLLNRITNAIATYGSAVGTSSKALDVGCGRQPFRELIESAGHQYFSTDVDQNDNGSVNFVLPIDGEPTPDILATAPFDVMLCTEVLEHVVDWSTAFCNLAKLSKPGTRIIITCPQFYMLHEEPYDFWRPTMYALTHFAKRENFRVLYSDSAGGPWEVLGTLLGSTYIQSATDTFADRVLAKLMRMGLNFLFNRIVSGSIQKRLSLVGRLYLSNIAVLEKAQ